MEMAFNKPRPATQKDINSIIDKFAHAAEYLAKSGYDGIQLHGAHGYLLAYPLQNHKQENRLIRRIHRKPIPNHPRNIGSNPQTNKLHLHPRYQDEQCRIPRRWFHARRRHSRMSTTRECEIRLRRAFGRYLRSVGIRAQARIDQEARVFLLGIRRGNRQAAFEDENLCYGRI